MKNNFFGSKLNTVLLIILIISIIIALVVMKNNKKDWEYYFPCEYNTCEKKVKELESIDKSKTIKDLEKEMH
jgi:uncharacterized protein YxeA